MVSRNRPGQIVSVLKSTIPAKLFKCIDKDDIVQLTEELLSRVNKEPLGLPKVVDTRKYTLLTFCAYKNNMAALKMIYEYVTDSEPISEEELSEWVNKPTDRGFTALHFAAYYGDLDMVDFLVVVCKAKLDALTRTG